MQYRPRIGGISCIKGGNHRINARYPVPRSPTFEPVTHRVITVALTNCDQVLLNHGIRHTCQLAGINQRRSLARLRAPQALTISTRQFRLTRHQVVARQPCLKSNEGAQICTGFDRAASRTHVRQSQQFTLHHRPDSLLNLLCGNAVVLTII
ncbi:hypothetical protein D3C71_1315160 [compost metagenome]